MTDDERDDLEHARRKAEVPLASMSWAIMALRDDYGELADKLTRIKEQWVREVMEATRG